MAQNTCVETVSPSDTVYLFHEFNVDVPVGQTFVGHSFSSNCDLIRVKSHTGSFAYKTDTFTNRLVTSFHTLNQRKAVSSQISNSASGSVYKYEMSSISSESPENFILEVNPFALRPSNLNLQLGFGSARLDLSDLTISGINIQSGGASIIVSYNSPNRTAMKELKIQSGMGDIKLRNIELARAENINIESSMGNTTLVIGSEPQSSTTIRIESGTGNTAIYIRNDVPVKLVITSNLFSSVEIPVDFVKTGPNVYVNLAYKKASMDKVVTIYSDVALGSFVLATYDQ